MRTRSHLRATTAALAVALFATACGGGSSDSDGAAEGEAAASTDGDPGPPINFAYQPGTSYAPFVLMKHEELLEEMLPGVEVNWQTLGGGADVRDGIAGGRLEMGAGGVPPFLIGRDTDVQWCIASGMNNYPAALLTMDDSIQSIEDIGPEDRIGVTTPGATQDLTLRKLADEAFGEPNRFEDQLVGLPHPDSVAALESGSLQVHGSNTPFQAAQIEAGARSLGDLYDAFGESTLIVAYAADAFVEDRPEQYAAVKEVLREAIRVLNEEPERAVEALVAELEGADPEQLLTDVTDPDLTWTETPTGLFETAQFMAEIDLLSEPLDRWEDAVCADVTELEGS